MPTGERPRRAHGGSDRRRRDDRRNREGPRPDRGRRRRAGPRPPDLAERDHDRAGRPDRRERVRRGRRRARIRRARRQEGRHEDRLRGGPRHTGARRGGPRMGDRGTGRKGRFLTWRRARWGLVAIALLLPVARAGQLYLEGAGAPLRVGIVYDPSSLPELRYVRDAYESVFREEGIPHAWVSTRELSLLSGFNTADRCRSRFFPVSLNHRKPVELRDRVGEF